MAAAMLAICLLALVATTNTAEATPLPENGKIAYSELQSFPGEDFEIYTMLPDGTDVRQITDKKGRDQKPTWSSDGAKLVWMHGDGQVWVHDFETGRQRMVVNIRGGVDSEVVWSPDGSKLAYSKATPEGKEADIYVMKADGTNQNNLTNTPSVEEWEVTWSPDGSKLAYTRHTWPTTRENLPDIYVMNSDGTNPVNLTDTLPEVMSVANPTWSPDGTKIAFNSGPWAEFRGRSGIYVMDADGTNPVNITSPKTPNLSGSPVWSPDGTKMAFHTCLGEDGQDCNIYVMNADGTNPVNITNKPEGYYGFGSDGGHTLDWQPLPGPTPPKDADGSNGDQGTKKPAVDDVDRDRPERTVIVKPGDSLWSISEQGLGPEASPQRVYDQTYQMYALNRNLIGSDPDLIFAGQRLSLPPPR
jgi:Tol biopolymer transport system component